MRFWTGLCRHQLLLNVRLQDRTAGATRKAPNPNCSHLWQNTRLISSNCGVQSVINQETSPRSQAISAGLFGHMACEKGSHEWRMFAKQNNLKPGAVALMRQWNLLSSKDCKHYAALARANSVQTKALSSLQQQRQSEMDGLKGGFWDTSPPTSVPMLKEGIQPHLSNMSAEADCCMKDNCSLRPGNSKSFDGAPAMNSPLWARCQPGLCPHDLPNGREAYSDSFQVMLLEIIFRKAPKPPIVPEEPLVLEFASVSAGKTFYVAMAFNIRKKPVSWMRARRMVSNHPGPSWFQLVNNGLLAAWPCWAMWSFASAWRNWLRMARQTHHFAIELSLQNP